MLELHGRPAYEYSAERPTALYCSLNCIRVRSLILSGADGFVFKTHMTGPITRRDALLRAAALASVFLAREEFLASTDMATQAFKEAEERADRVTTPEVNAQLQLLR